MDIVELALALMCGILSSFFVVFAFAPEIVAKIAGAKHSFALTGLMMFAVRCNGPFPNRVVKSFELLMWVFIGGIVVRIMMFDWWLVLYNVIFAVSCKRVWFNLMYINWLIDTHHKPIQS